MPVLPGAVRHAAQTCRGDGGTQGGVSEVTFALDVTTAGRFEPSGAMPTDPFGRCLVEQLARHARPPNAGARRVTVQLQLSR
jgi:hypothetical protein